MQPIKVMTPSFVFLGEIDDYESLQFTRRFQRPGEFELHINLNKNNTETLQEDHFIVLSTNKVGVIRHREIKQENTEQLMVRGYTLQGILSRRITVPPDGEAYDKLNSNAESVLKHYVRQNAVDSISSRVIPNLIMADDQGRGPVVEWQSRYKNLAEELEAIAFTSGLGWDIVLDFQQQTWKFEVFEPTNRTVSQNEIPPVIFSTHFDNIKSHTFIESSMGTKNTAFVGGQGEGANRAIAEVGESTGFKRVETFIDARDLEEAVNLTTRGNQKLQELQKVFSFEAEILTHGPFEYEKDWDLGDRVTIQDQKLGITLDTPIPEIKEIYEPSGFRLEATFGKSTPTLIDKIKKSISNTIL
ncbi:siphovirus ReqiPepy6 Gp37-like family protein [Chengkuizengella sp. SCS-71B]|uniref:siphovirus ReqiPepy6 Gp37-like family protein n=1 Tax=Chengkuizengella sp. SCS-71B TaxID=3115290 RepID=UPI0032C2408E